jgi:hypothetical protein
MLGTTFLLSIIQDTAEKSGVNEIAQFNTKVENVSKEDGHWKVRTSTLKNEDVEAKTRDWVSPRASHEEELTS